MIQIDIPMPKNCAQCPCRDYDDIMDEFSCNLTFISRDLSMLRISGDEASERRHNSCPLKTQKPGWISVKDRMPDEHDSIFAGRAQLSKYLWSKESDNVNVYAEFPDGTGRVTEGRLQDGKWWTRISPVLIPVVTHWMPLPTPPEEKCNDD